MLLYKYRALNEWKFIVDVFLHKRLYAAPYKDLNDPMEGYYSYASGNHLSIEYDRQVRHAKNDWRLCSLSSEYRSTLMWSYYGGGHKGIAIGVSRPRQNTKRRVEKVTYDNTITLNSKPMASPRDTAVAILSQKLYSWKHECEYRVFTRDSYFKVSIQEILLGCKIAKDDEALVRKIAESLKPKVVVRKLRTSELIADYGP